MLDGAVAFLELVAHDQRVEDRGAESSYRNGSAPFENCGDIAREKRSQNQGQTDDGGGVAVFFGTAGEKHSQPHHSEGQDKADRNAAEEVGGGRIGQNICVCDHRVQKCIHLIAFRFLVLSSARNCAELSLTAKFAVARSETSRTRAGAAVHLLEFHDAIRNRRMVVVKLGPELLQLGDEAAVLRLLFDRCRVEHRVDDDRVIQRRPESLLALRLRTMRFDELGELQQTGRQSARVLRELRAQCVGARLARANHEELNDAHQLLRDVKDRIGDDGSDNRRKQLLVLQTDRTLDHLDHRDPAVDDSREDLEEERREHAEERVDADVAVLDVSELMRKNAFDFVVRHAHLRVEQSSRDGDDRASGEGSGGESVRQRIRREVNRRHVRQPGLGHEALDDRIDALALGALAIERDGFRDVERNLVREHPAEHADQRIEQPESRLEAEAEARRPEGDPHEGAEKGEAADRLQPGLHAAVLDGVAVHIANILSHLVSFPVDKESTLSQSQSRHVELS